MNNKKDSLFGLGLEEQKRLFGQLRPAMFVKEQSGKEQRLDTAAVPDRLALFTELPAYKQLQVHRLIAQKMEIMDPFFTSHERIAKRIAIINGEEYLNFATYDYLGLNGHPEVTAAAYETMQRFGTSAGASRVVAGERPDHKLLEQALADHYETEAALIFVSGHATNVSTISTLLGPHDAVYHDALAHNSIIMGALLSGAARYSYPHNDCDALDRLLQQSRRKHQRVLIVTEGLFSMDGSIANLPALVEIKKRHTCFLMVDEAHSLGVLGGVGRGSAEHCGIPFADVDIWMGTLSKTLCSCGGFIAARQAFIDLLKFKAPGFVYSVGMSPPLAAASRTALSIMQREPERVARLQRLSALFLQQAKERGLNTGHAEGFGVIPVIVGNSIVAGSLASAMFKRHINVMPIIYPVVEEGLARLRFFLSCDHEEGDIARALSVLCKQLPKAVKKSS
jgi:7-keto-8-aminopelargonate synthetase and related enzymes